MAKPPDPGLTFCPNPQIESWKSNPGNRTWNRDLTLDQKHHPTRRNRAPDEHGEAEGPEPEHHLRLAALRNPEHHRSKQREQQHRTKMRDRHERFLPVASECASTAAMTFSSPA